MLVAIIYIHLYYLFVPNKRLDSVWQRLLFVVLDELVFEKALMTTELHVTRFLSVYQLFCQLVVAQRIQM